jgi:hypothetical protein
VDIVRRYERVGGVRVPVEMSSTADVRIAGASSFVMTYDYTMINGQPIVGTTLRDCGSGDASGTAAELAKVSR